MQTVIRLNASTTQGPAIAADSITTFDGQPVNEAATVAQMAKLAYGAQGDLRTISLEQPLPVANAEPTLWSVGFEDKGYLNSPGFQGDAVGKMQALAAAAGTTLLQTTGALQLQAGTGAGAQVIARSTSTFQPPFIARFKAIPSTRLANRSLRFELADMVAEYVQYTLTDANTLVITNPFPDSRLFIERDIGKRLRLSPYPIAGVVRPETWVFVQAVTETQATLYLFTSWSTAAPAAGRCDLYGLNSFSVEYSGTNAAQVNVESVRDGYTTGAKTIGIAGIGAAGHLVQITHDGLSLGMSDAIGGGSSVNWTPRASFAENLPNTDRRYYFFISAQNGVTPPASDPQHQIFGLAVQETGRQRVRIGATDSVGNQQTQLAGTANAVHGNAGYGANVSGNPIPTAAPAAVTQPAARAAGQLTAPLVSKVGHTVVQIGQIRELNDTNSMVTLTTATETTIVPAVAATFSDLCSLTMTNTSATGVRLDLRSAAAGAVVDSFWLPAMSTLQVNPVVAYKQAAVNTAWTAQLSAAVSDVRVSARTVRNV